MAMDDGAATTLSGAMDIGGMPVGNDEAPVLGNPVLAAIERRSSTRSFAKDAEVQGIPNVSFEEILKKADYLVITLGHTLFKDNKKLIAEKPYYDCVGLMEK